MARPRHFAPAHRLVEKAPRSADAVGKCGGAVSVAVNRRAITTGAAAFSRNRRPILCPHGGLVAGRNSTPEHSRTVVLHEFSHTAP